MFGCRVTNHVPDGEEELGLEEQKLLQDQNVDHKNLEMCKNYGTDVQLSPNGQWLRAVGYSVYIPVTSISSVRVMRSKKWMGVPVTGQNLVCLEICVVNSERKDTTLIGAHSSPLTLDSYSFNILSNPMKYSDAAKFISRLTGFEISEEIPAPKGPTMP